MPKTITNNIGHCVGCGKGLTERDNVYVEVKPHSHCADNPRNGPFRHEKGIPRGSYTVRRHILTCPAVPVTAEHR